MNPSVLLYATACALEAALAMMLFIGWRALRADGTRWPGLLAAGYALASLRCGLMAAGYGNVGYDGAAWWPTTLMITAATVLVNAGIIDYVELPRRVARRLNIAGNLLAWSSTTSLLLHWLTRGQGNMMAIPFFVAWSVLFVRAMRREPGCGHGVVVLALFTFPVNIVAARLGLLPFAFLPMIELVPLCAIGLTVLTTGLVRAHQRAQRETAQAARALGELELAQAQLRAANEGLEQRVAQRTAELRETIEGLESFNRSVSHDLRGPLGGIAEVARLAHRHLTQGDAAQADRLLGAIERQAVDSVQLVASLLALARAGDLQLQRLPVDVAAVVGEAVLATAGQGAPSPQAQVVVRPLPVVDADRDLLRQVFVNLIGNARKFARGSAHPQVEVGHASTAQGEAFYVRDNGVGFTAAQAERLFRPFQRLHGARFEGFGIGLSIVRRIVDHHGGRIWAEGLPGEGATFWFTLE